MPFDPTWHKLRRICRYVPEEEECLRRLCAGARVENIADLLECPVARVRGVIRAAQRKGRDALPWIYEVGNIWRDVDGDLRRDAALAVALHRNEMADRKPHRTEEEGIFHPPLLRADEMHEYWRDCLTGGVQQRPGRPMSEVVIVQTCVQGVQMPGWRRWEKQRKGDWDVKRGKR